MRAFILAACSLLCLAAAFVLAVGLVSFSFANILLLAAPCLGIAAIITAVVTLCTTARQPWWNLAAMAAACPSLLLMPFLLMFIAGLWGAIWG